MGIKLHSPAKQMKTSEISRAISLTTDTFTSPAHLSYNWISIEYVIP